MGSFPFPSEASVLHAYSCPVAEMADTIAHTGRLRSRGCKRRHDSLQGASPLQSAFVVAGSLPFDTVPYGKGSGANRSASMDSDISSWSPVPKRHCFYPPQACSKPDSAQLEWHQTQQQDALQQQQHATLEVPSLSNGQQAYALEVMLSQSTAPQTAALVAALRHLQCLRQAAALHHTHAQALSHSSQSTMSQPAAWQSNNRLPVSTLLKLQASYSQLLQAPQSQQHRGDKLPQQHVVTDNRQTSLASSTQLHSISTPAQHSEESGLASHAHPVAPIWYQNHAVRAESNTAAYEPVQPQMGLQWAAYPEQPSQPEFAWHSAAAVCEAPSQQPLTGVTTQLLHRQQQQQQQQMAFQLAQENRLRLHQHKAREQQALLDRQAALSTIRPALTFPELVAYWARDLSLQRCESVYLACHLWTRVQQQVSIAYMHLLGAEKPWETMLLGCLWLAAKLEECRRGVPTASKAGALVGVDKGVMGGVELYLMQLVSWAPLAEWKDRPLQFEDDSWR
ncbi:hypothetical protein ABBQ32_008371 [Trebouxia sp. C0010 RCD-2024]